MSITNYATREVLFKIVLCGPPFAGKSTTLHYIHANLDAAARSDIVTVTNGADRTLSFEFTPRDTTLLDGFAIRIQLFTVPGEVSLDLTLKRALRDADGILFVADSEWDRLEENVRSFNGISAHLKKLGNPLDGLPVVLQYNKRDLPGTAPAHYLEFILNNRKKRLASHETSATVGTNVFAALRTLAEMLVRHFNNSSNARPEGTSAAAQTA